MGAGSWITTAAGYIALCQATVNPSKTTTSEARKDARTGRVNEPGVDEILHLLQKTLAKRVSEDQNDSGFKSTASHILSGETIQPQST